MGWDGGSSIGIEIGWMIFIQLSEILGVSKSIERLFNKIIQIQSNHMIYIQIRLKHITNLHTIMMLYVFYLLLNLFLCHVYFNVYNLFMSSSSSFNMIFQ